MKIDAGISSFLEGVFGANRDNRPLNLDINDIRDFAGTLGLNGEGTAELMNILLDADANVGASFQFDREDGGTVSIDVGADIQITIDSPLGSAVYTLANVDGNIEVSLKDNSNGRLGLSVDLLANISSDLLKGLSAVLDGALNIAQGNIDFSLGGNIKLDQPLFGRWRNS
jgi:hypothetical protein